MKTEPYGAVSVVLGRDLSCALDAAAASELISRAALVKRLIVQHLRQLGRLPADTVLPRSNTASAAVLQRTAGTP